MSELTRAEAVQLLSDGGKLPCLRIYRRQDGRVMTADCATRRERVWKWLDRRSAWAAALFALVCMAGCNSQLDCTAGSPAPILGLDGVAEQVTKDAAISIVEGMTAVPPTRPEPGR